MAHRQQRERHPDMLVSWAKVRHSLGHVFYDKLYPGRSHATSTGSWCGQCAPNTRRGELLSRMNCGYHDLLGEFFRKHCTNSEKCYQGEELEDGGLAE